MPKVDSSQVQPGQNGAPALYGTQSVENSLPFQERLMRRFGATEWVIIENIDDQPVFWQYLRPEDEEKDFTQDGMQQITRRKEPEMWRIDPGQQEVLLGSSAYMALDVMYKNYTSSATLRKSKDPNSSTFDAKGEHLPKNFNFADGGAQENFINLAFKGKANPTFSIPQQAAPAADVEAAKEAIGAKK